MYEKYQEQFEKKRELLSNKNQEQGKKIQEKINKERQKKQEVDEFFKQRAQRELEEQDRDLLLSKQNQLLGATIHELRLREVQQRKQEQMANWEDKTKKAFEQRAKQEMDVRLKAEKGLSAQEESLRKKCKIAEKELREFKKRQ